MVMRIPTRTGKEYEELYKLLENPPADPGTYVRMMAANLARLSQVNDEADILAELVPEMVERFPRANLAAFSAMINLCVNKVAWKQNPSLRVNHIADIDNSEYFDYYYEPFFDRFGLHHSEARKPKKRVELYERSLEMYYELEEWDFEEDWHPLVVFHYNFDIMAEALMPDLAKRKSKKKVAA